MKPTLLVTSLLFLVSSALVTTASANHTQSGVKNKNATQTQEYIKRKKMAQWFDATLLKSGAVDANYKITNESKVKDFFDNVNKETSSDKAARRYAKAPLTKDMTFSPRGLTISNILQPNSADASQAELIKYYNSSESEAIMLAETCPFIYNSKYALANGYRSTYQLINKHNKVVFKKSIDKAYCDRAGQ